jgi:RNA polymerase sigma factor (sigma-70 family)
MPVAEEAHVTEVSRVHPASTSAVTGAGASTPTGALLDRARGGDQSAFRQLIEGQRSWLERQARRLWPRRLDRRYSPSDFVQEAHAAAARNIGRCPSQSKTGFRGWLKKILVRIRDQALRQVTAVKRNIGREEPLPGDSARGSALHETHTPVESRVARDELIGRMNCALVHLEDRDQELLRLHYLDGLTFEQLAVRLEQGHNAAALRQRTHRLLERLRKGIPLLTWSDGRGWPPIRSHALGLWRLRAWSPARVARELDIPEAAVVAWIEAVPVHLRESTDPGGLL